MKTHSSLQGMIDVLANEATMMEKICTILPKPKKHGKCQQNKVSKMLRLSGNQRWLFPFLFMRQREHMFILAYHKVYDEHKFYLAIDSELICCLFVR